VGPPWCLPGTYTFAYTLQVESPDDGVPEAALSATADRSVVVEWRQVIRVELRLFLSAPGVENNNDTQRVIRDALPNVLIEAARLAAVSLGVTNVPVTTVSMAEEEDSTAEVDGGAGGRLMMTTVFMLHVASPALMLWARDGTTTVPTAAATAEALKEELTGEGAAALLRRSAEALHAETAHIMSAVDWEATEVEASLGAHSPPLDWRSGKYAALVAEVRRAEARLGAAWVRLGDVSAGEEARSLGSSVAADLALEARTEAVFEELRAMDGMVAEMEAELAEGLREMLPPGWFEEQPERVSALLGVMDDLDGSQAAVLERLQSVVPNRPGGQYVGSEAAADPSSLPYNHPIFTVPNAHKMYRVEFTLTTNDTGAEEEEHSDDSDDDLSEDGTAAASGSGVAGRRMMLQQREAVTEGDAVPTTSESDSGKDETGTGGVTLNTRTTGQWSGYPIVKARPAEKMKEVNSPRPRWFGASPGSNALLGGVQLHMTRRPVDYAPCENLRVDSETGIKQSSHAFLIGGGLRFRDFATTCSALYSARGEDAYKE